MFRLKIELINSVFWTTIPGNPNLNIVCSKSNNYIIDQLFKVVIYVNIII